MASAAQISILPLGSNEGLMANTGTGSTDLRFPSYYNPAALSWIHEKHFSFSGVALNSVSSKGDQINFQSQKISTTNLFAVLTPAMGNVGMYLFLPTDYEYQVELKESTLNLEANSTGFGRLVSREQVAVAGLSFAPRNIERDWWSFGINAQVEFQEQNSDYTFYKVKNTNDGGSLSAVNVKKSHLALAVGFGNIYQISSNFSLGYVITLPSFRLTRKNDSSSRFISYNYEVPGSFRSTGTVSPSDDLESLPFRSRLGLELKGSILTWRADVEHQESQKYFNKQINFASGFDINLSRSTSLLMGLRRNIEKNFGVNESIEATLVTLGMEMRSKEFINSLGGYSLASGQGNNTSKTSVYGLVFNTLYRF